MAHSLGNPNSSILSTMETFYVHHRARFLVPEIHFVGNFLTLGTLGFAFV